MHPATSAVVSDSVTAEVGGLPVHRTLPRRVRRMVGAWCFLDHFGPTEVSAEHTMAVGPHPHIGLHTVTWVLKGEVEHTDSLGNRQVIRPGQLNLMTAGQGIAHAEDARGRWSGTMEAAQLWVAQPERARHGTPDFAHHADLPRLELGSGTATVLVGTFAGASSPARTDTPLMGVDLEMSPESAGKTTLPLDAAFEHGLAVLHGSARVADVTVAPNQLAYLAPGSSEVNVTLEAGTRALLLGGVPFDEDILMWWNFVARERAEMDAARTAWATENARFGPVSSTLARIDAPVPAWAAPSTG